MTSNKCYDQYGFPVTHLTQWDSNVILKIHNYKCDVAPIVHFSTEQSESSKTVRSTLGDSVVSVVVPNSLLIEKGVLDVCVYFSMMKLRMMDMLFVDTDYLSCQSRDLTTMST